MRWKIKSEPQFLDTRIKEHFLFFPKKIENEWRWLEKLNINNVMNFVIMVELNI